MFSQSCLTRFCPVWGLRMNSVSSVRQSEEKEKSVEPGAGGLNEREQSGKDASVRERVSDWFGNGGSCSEKVMSGVLYGEAVEDVML